MRIDVCIALDDELMPADYRRIFLSLFKHAMQEYSEKKLLYYFGGEAMKKNYCTIFAVLLISFVLLQIPVCRDILHFHNSAKKVKNRTPTMITNVSKSVFSYGGDGGARTPDLLDVSEAL